MNNPIRISLLKSTIILRLRGIFQETKNELYSNSIITYFRLKRSGEKSEIIPQISVQFWSIFHYTNWKSIKLSYFFYAALNWLVGNQNANAKLTSCIIFSFYSFSFRESFNLKNPAVNFISKQVACNEGEISINFH